MLTTIVLSVLIAGIGTTPAAYQSALSLGDDGSYQFFYETGKEAGSHSREEARGPDGVVVGKYSYQDPTGDVRVVNYRADDFGYVAKGDVGVPGAPQAQFPAEEEQDDEKKQQTKDDQQVQDSETTHDEKEPSSTPEPQSENEDYEDDVKSIKIQEPSYDGPPDGFPLGFFDQGFQGLRRLPEPTKEEEIQEGSKSDSSATNQEDSTSSEPSKDDEQSTTTTKPEEPKVPIHATHNFGPLFPFSQFDPHAGHNAPFLQSANVQHPVYVYSYQHPQAHGYYYFY